MINATTPISSFQLATGNSPSEISFMHGKSLETHDWWTNPCLTRAEEKMRVLNRWRYKSIRPCYKIIHLCTPHSDDTHHRNTYWWLLHHKRNDYRLRTQQPAWRGAGWFKSKLHSLLGDLVPEASSIHSPKVLLQMVWIFYHLCPVYHWDQREGVLMQTVVFNDSLKGVVETAANMTF